MRAAILLLALGAMLIGGASGTERPTRVVRGSVVVRMRGGIVDGWH